MGAPPSIDGVAMPKGRSKFAGGEMIVNDMFQYVSLFSGVEFHYDTGTAARR